MDPALAAAAHAALARCERTVAIGEIRAGAAGRVRTARRDDVVRAVAQFAETTAAARVAETEAAAHGVVSRREEAARDEASLSVLNDLAELADAVDGVLPLLQGDAALAVKALDRRIDRMFAARGFRRVPGAGSAFDPRWHESVGTEEGGEKGVVVREVARGYVRGDLVLRAARVVVGGSA